MSKAKEIAQYISTRLALISIANGYKTDIGLKNYRGRTSVDTNRMPCVILFEGEDVRQDDRPGLAQAKVEQHYDIEGHSRCDPDFPNDMAHDMIADIKKAIFSAPKGLSGLVLRVRYTGRAIAAREDGLDTVGSIVKIAVEYGENLAEP